MRKTIDMALAGTNAATASPLLRAMLPCALVCSLIGGSTALADSKSSAEFTLATCLAAMDDLARVEVLAKENNWADKTPANSAAMSKFLKSQSTWEVTQGEDKFIVATGVYQSGENSPARNVCTVLFPGKNVNREEFFNLISTSVELTFKSDTRFPQTRGELYGIKSDRTDGLGLYITSRSDGTLISAVFQEMPRSAPVYGRLGVRFQRVTEDIAAGKKLKSARGVLVMDVDDTGAAKPAGIQVGDIIIRMDGKDIADIRDLPRIVAETPADKSVDVAVIREGEEKILSVTLGR
jgi:PDZ domain